MLRLTLPVKHMLAHTGRLQRLVSRRGPIPALSCIMVAPGESSVSFAATDLEVAMRSTLEFDSCVSVENAQTDDFFLVPGAKLHDIVKSLPSDDSLVIEVSQTGAVNVTSGSFRSRLQVHPKEDYPNLPFESEEETIAAAIFESSAMGTALDLVEPCIGSGGSRYFLGGVTLRLLPNTARLYSADGHRMARATFQISGDTTSEAMVPATSVKELREVCDSGLEIDYKVKNSHLFFSVAGLKLATRVMDATPPDFERVMPRGITISIRVPRKPFLDIARRVALVSSIDTRSVRVEVKNGRLSVSSTAQDVGEAFDAIEIESQTTEAELSFSMNATYVLDFLGAETGDNIILESAGKSGAILFRPDDSEGVEYRYVSMPLSA